MFYTEHVSFIETSKCYQQSKAEREERKKLQHQEKSSRFEAHKKQEKIDNSRMDPSLTHECPICGLRAKDQKQINYHRRGGACSIRKPDENNNKNTQKAGGGPSHGNALSSPVCVHCSRGFSNEDERNRHQGKLRANLN